MKDSTNFIKRVLRAYNARKNRGVLIAQTRVTLTHITHDEPHLKPLALQR